MENHWHEPESSSSHLHSCCHLNCDKINAKQKHQSASFRFITLMEHLKSTHVLLFCAVLIFFIYYGLQPFEYPMDGFTEPHHVDIINATKVILCWNQIFSDPYWGFGYSPYKLECGNEVCVITNNRSLLPKLQDFDALLFHAAQSFKKPLQRDPKQIYVFATIEAPPNTHHSLVHEENYYNLTMTYRLDSDIRQPYADVLDKETGSHVAPAQYPKWRKSSYIDKFTPSTCLRGQLKGKRKTAVWFVSHCKTYSHREKLVKKLQKYISVDIYGKCGSLSCPLDKQDDCNAMIDNDYKFYLSFENSLCTDYVTEKFYRALERTVLPIVFGGANYSRFMPSKSYINVEDFANVEELGKFLLNLEQNLTEYEKYYWWKEFYTIEEYNLKRTYCGLCRKLHNKALSHRVQFYHNIKDYWMQSCRLESKIKF